MNRRKFLAGAGMVTASLAGCISTDHRMDGTVDDNPEGVSESNCDPLASTNPKNEPGDEFPSIELLAESSKRDHIAIQTNLLRQFDTAGPAHIEIVVMNVSDEEQRLTFHDSAPFPPYTGFHSDEETGLFIGPESGYQIDFPDEPTEGCWQIDDVPAISDVEDTVELGPCEAISETYRVYHIAGEDCLKEGEYVFEISDMGELGHEWGFTLRLEKPS